MNWCFSFVIIHAFSQYWKCLNILLCRLIKLIGYLIFWWTIKSLLDGDWKLVGEREDGDWKLHCSRRERRWIERGQKERKKEELWLLSVLFISMNCQAQLRLPTSIDFCRLAWFNKYLGDCGRCDIHVLISLSLGYDLFLLPRFGFELCVLALLPIQLSSVMFVL